MSLEVIKQEKAIMQTLNMMWYNLYNEDIGQIVIKKAVRKEIGQVMGENNKALYGFFNKSITKQDSE